MLAGGHHRAVQHDTAPFATVLDHLTTPADGARVASALLGLPRRPAHQVANMALAASAEADHLLEAMPQLLRSLAIATTDRPERCFGEIRGPVLWSETVSARSASAGDPGLFVCATTTKAYDTPENRVLKAALAALAAAGASVEAGSSLGGGTEGSARRARSNGQLAARFLEHRTLADVPVVQVRGRALRRTRAGRRRSTYEPALALLRRAAQPLTADGLASLADEATTAQVGVLAAVLDAWPPSAGRLALRTSHGALVGGPVRFEHPSGVTVDGVAVRERSEGSAAVARAIRPNLSAGRSPA